MTEGLGDRGLDSQRACVKEGFGDLTLKSRCGPAIRVCPVARALTRYVGKLYTVLFQLCMLYRTTVNCKIHNTYCTLCRG